MDKAITDKDAITCELGLAKIIPQIQQYFKPNSILFYIDFTASVIIGNTALYWAAIASSFSGLQVFWTFVSAMSLFRATVFMHEIAHSAKTIKGFTTYYNLLHGFLHKIPAYNYSSHRYHHMPRTYGTKQDAEYDTLGHKSAFYNLFAYPFGVMFFVPCILIIRWGLIPFIEPFIGEKGRLWFYTYSSTLALHLPYERPAPTNVEKLQWYKEDAGCALYTIVTLALLFNEVLPWNIMIVWYVVVYILSVSNMFRGLLNHRYLTGFVPTTHKQQIIDTITLPLSVFNNLFYPLGLSYHGLHHMFPQIPYHNMRKVHNILMGILPPDHPYRVTLIKNFPDGIRKLIAREI